MKKVKHDHKGTKILKLGIFASLMLAPLMAIGFKCAYVTFNKNAKDSYSNEYVENLTFVNSTAQLLEGSNYLINYSENTTATASWNISIYDTNLYDYIDTNNRTIKTLYFINESYARLNITFTDNTTLRVDNWNTYTTSFVVEYKSGNFNPVTSPLSRANMYLITYTTQKLDNAFYYAIDEAMESQYFAWARTSALYTPTSTMTQGMGINTNAVPTLLVYWLILTAIYVVVDIVIELFTYLTHMITSRLEE